MEKTSAALPTGAVVTFETTTVGRVVVVMGACPAGESSPTARLPPGCTTPGLPSEPTGGVVIRGVVTRGVEVDGGVVTLEVVEVEAVVGESAATNVSPTFQTHVFSPSGGIGTRG
jgi:hypothetical protein